MRHWDTIGLADFLATHQRIRISEISDSQLVLSGDYHLNAQLPGSHLVNRTYSLKLIIPAEYPEKLPTVLDDGKYFPRNQEHHTYDDGSFCLGSEIRIKSLLRDDHSLSVFFDKIIDRFLYSVTHRIEFGSFPYGELAHGEQGLIDDYGDLFGLNGKPSVLLALRALGKRKRQANKLPCPCGCRLRLGACSYRFNLKKFRSLNSLSWYRKHIKENFTEEN